MSLARCDCLNECGDDPRLQSGEAGKCEHWARLHPPKGQHCGGRGYTAPAVAEQLCCCFPGTCRGGQVINGRTVSGQLCRESA